MKDKDNGAVGMRRSGPGWLVYLGKVAEWLEHLPPNPGGRWVDTRVTQQIFSYSTGCLTGTWLRRVLGKVGRRERGTEREKNQRKGKGCYGNYSIYVYHNKKSLKLLDFILLLFCVCICVCFECICLRVVVCTMHHGTKCFCTFVSSINPTRHWESAVHWNVFDSEK